MIVAKLTSLVQDLSQAKYLHASLYWCLLLMRAKKTFATVTFEKSCPPAPFPNLFVLLTPPRCFGCRRLRNAHP